jgi:hypothetical protein
MVGKPSNAIFTCVFFGLLSARDCGVSNKDKTNFQCLWHYNKSQWSRLGIDNLDHLVLVIKIWPNNVHVQCDRGKAKNLHDYLQAKQVMIEEHNKIIEEKGLFEEDYEFN